MAELGFGPGLEEGVGRLPVGRDVLEGAVEPERAFAVPHRLPGGPHPDGPPGGREKR
eukprot:gene45441-60710_t